MVNFVELFERYCTITYVLDVGNRHLDDQLIMTGGYFFFQCRFWLYI